MNKLTTTSDVNSQKPTAGMNSCKELCMVHTLNEVPVCIIHMHMQLSACHANMVISNNNSSVVTGCVHTLCVTLVCELLMSVCL